MSFFNRRRESLNTPKEIDENANSWGNAMKKVDDFSTHMAKLEASKTQRAMDKIGITESRKDDATFEEDLMKIESSDALRLLDFINGTLTGAKKGERKTLGYGVWGGAEIGGHLSPAPDVQAAAIEETFDAIKNDVKDNRKRAALIYYMVNHLHLFNDGNGRTSRVMYDVFAKNDFNIAGSQFIHKTDDASELGDRESFARERGLKPNPEVRELTFDLVKKDLKEENLLPIGMMNSSYTLNLPTGNRSMPDVYLTEDAKTNLTRSEKRIVSHAFFEKPIAATSLGMMLKRKSTASRVIRQSTRAFSEGQNVIAFDIENKDATKAAEVFKGWNANDYRAFCTNVKDLQLRQTRKLIDVFKNEDKYVMPNGQTYADYFSGKDNK